MAESGANGLTHLKLDRRLGLADGTTSFYFRTRAALLRAVAARVAELDTADLRAVSESDAGTAPSALASMIMESASEPRATRTRARYELLLHAGRDPELAAEFRENSAHFAALHRDIVVRLQPGSEPPDDDLIDEQTFATITFINGIMMGMAMGDRTIADAAQLDRLLSGIVAGVARSVST
ncbi:TetR family transcriptional regulator C-terminal domain-containing protein [Nocardia sp. NPDC050697]|uniref:TetR/AcrR family transcriptional regulator n=1 Tax=Nocardia sp. NPDC050697 TaxID=3155158 RepID=UPI0033EC9C21